MVRLMVVGEGPHELGDPDTWETDGRASEAAMPTLVHRILCEPAEVCYHKVKLSARGSRTERRRAKHIHGRGTKASGRVKTWIDRALRADCHGVIILWDRDGDTRSDRLAQMKVGRDEMANDTDTEYPACAVGVAVESFDAWMIADGNALGRAEGNGAISHPTPENLSAAEAKERAQEIFGDEDGLRRCYATVAEHVNMKTLANCCPAGFAPFKQEIEQRIQPLVQEN